MFPHKARQGETTSPEVDGSIRSSFPNHSSAKENQKGQHQDITDEIHLEPKEISEEMEMAQFPKHREQEAEIA